MSVNEHWFCNTNLEKCNENAGMACRAASKSSLEHVDEEAQLALARWLEVPLGSRDLLEQAVVQRRDAGGRDVGALKFRNVAAVADDADAVAQIGLQIQIGRGGDERDDLAAFVDERKLGSAGPAGDDRPQDALRIVRAAGCGCRNGVWQGGRSAA